jgi:L-2-hydroxyglutarate oxidase LhgO
VTVTEIYAEGFMVHTDFDIAIIGGGIVGLATAMALRFRHPEHSLAVIEKEAEPASHQTGHNSGVIHAGIYYKPGSNKAKLCVEGARLMMEFCDAAGVPYDRCGKLIVATDDSELPRLEALYERGSANGIRGVEMIEPERVREIEPHAKAVRALYSPNTAITDFQQVSKAMAAKVENMDGKIFLSSQVSAIQRSDSVFNLETSRSTIRCRNLINCAGLHADTIAKMAGLQPDALIIPFRGEYYSLSPGCRLVRGLIYPVPDPQFPFLGVHFTKRINGGYEAGPNAVLAFAREGYEFWNICWRDLLAMFGFSGFWAMARRHWRVQAYELHRSLSRRVFLHALQKLVPELEDADLAPGGSGVRAQVVTADGSLADDFLIVEAPQFSTRPLRPQPPP